MRIGGAFTGRVRPIIWRVAAVLAAGLASLALVACGNASSTPSGAEAPDNLITRAEVDKAKKGVEQAFLEYWSALQFQAWTEAASYFDPDLRKFAGTARIIGAKKLNGANYPLLKPSVVEVKSHAGLTTVKYYVRLPDGTKELAAASWHKAGGNWQIVYESRLDAELNQFGVNAVEIKRTGKLPAEVSEISRAAARAGYALGQLQAKFAERELKLETP